MEYTVRINLVDWKIIDIYNKILSPKYNLRIEKLRHKKKELPTYYYPDYLRVTILEKQYKLYSFLHNADQIPLLYVTQNNEEFLLTSANKQCISIYNLSQDIFSNYVFRNNEDFIQGRGFCPLSYEFLNNNLKIIGQVPDGPIEILIINQVNLNNLTFNNIQWEDYYEEEK